MAGTGWSGRPGTESRQKGMAGGNSSRTADGVDQIMWFKVFYLTYAGQERWATFSARDPKMASDWLQTLRIDPAMVQKLWVDTGDGWESWHPKLLTQILRDARGA